MSSSIFNFDFLKDLLEVWRAGKRRMIGMAVLLASLTVAGMVLLHSVFYYENFQVKAVYALGPQTRALGIGSSRMFFGVDPRAMPDGYMSLAANYLDMVGAERLWSKYEERLTGVKLVFLEFDMATLYYDMKELAPQALQPLGLDLVPEPQDLLLHPDQSIRQLLGPIFRWRLTPQFYENAQRDDHDPEEPQGLVAGFVPSKIRLTQAPFYAERKVEQTREHLRRFSTDLFERNFKALTTLLKRLDQKGIEVIFVRFPMDRHTWPVYESEWDRNVQEAYTAVWGSVGKRDFLDLSRDPRFETREFRDPDHLNVDGARRMTAILAARIVDSLY